MPLSVTLYAIGVWFLVGMFVGAGWTFGALVVGKILR